MLTTDDEVGVGVKPYLQGTQQGQQPNNPKKKFKGKPKNKTALANSMAADDTSDPTTVSSNSNDNSSDPDGQAVGAFMNDVRSGGLNEAGAGQRLMDYVINKPKQQPTPKKKFVGKLKGFGAQK